MESQQHQEAQLTQVVPEQEAPVAELPPVFAAQEPTDPEDPSLGKRSRRDITPEQQAEQEAVALVMEALQTNHSQIKLAEATQEEVIVPQTAAEPQEPTSNQQPPTISAAVDEPPTDPAPPATPQTAESQSLPLVADQQAAVGESGVEDIEPEHEPASDSYKKFRKEPAPELTLSEPVWDYPVHSQDSNGWVKRLKKPEEITPTQIANEGSEVAETGQITAEGVPQEGSNSAAQNALDWDQIKFVSIKLDGYDRTGTRLQWIKNHWPNPNLVKKIKKDWKYFMEGIKTAFELMKPGESSWFTLEEPAQKIPFVIGFPTTAEPVCIKIDLVSVEYKQKNFNPDKTPSENSQQNTYDLDGNFQKITTLKLEADRNYKLLHCVETGLNDYTEVHQKLTGLVSQLRKATIKPLWAIDAETLHVNVMNNLSLMHLKLQDHEKALEWIEKVLTLSPNNTKALFRKGKIFEDQNSLDEALLLYTQIEATEEIRRVTERKRSQRASFARLFEQSCKPATPIVEGQFSSSSSHKDIEIGTGNPLNPSNPQESTSSVRSLVKETPTQIEAEAPVSSEEHLVKNSFEKQVLKETETALMNSAAHHQLEPEGSFNTPALVLEHQPPKDDHLLGVATPAEEVLPDGNIGNEPAPLPAVSSITPEEANNEVPNLS